jgi:hypothetical protein
MSETAEATVQEAPQVVTNSQQIADVFENYFRVTAFGLVTCNSQVPNPMLWEAIASAMGAVISGATKGPDIAATLRAREHLCKVMTDAVRKRYPALDVGNIGTAASNSNIARGH